MSPKKKIISSIITLACLSGAIAVASSFSNDFLFSVTSLGGEYTFNFSSTANKITSSNGTITAKSRDNNNITFEYENFLTSNSCWGIMKPNASFGNFYSEDINHNELNGLCSIEVNFTGASTLNVGYGYYSSNQYNDVLTSGVSFNFNQEEPTYFSLSNLSNSNVTVNSITVKYTCEGNSFGLDKKSLDTYTIIVNENTPEAFAEAYSRAINLTDSELAKFNQIEIKLPSEDYYITNTLSFSGKRRNSKDIIINGNGKTIYGGNSITKGGWVEYKENIFVKQIGTNLSFSNLIVDGNGAQIAKSNIFQGLYDNENLIFKFKKNDFVSAGGTTETLTNKCLVCLEERWGGCIGVSTSIVFEKSVISSKSQYKISLNDSSSNVFFVNSRVYKDEEPYFYLANNLQLLDEVNEYFYDPISGNLYYYPSNPASINSSNFVIPSVQTILDTKGMAERITLKNITFNGSNFVEPLIYGFNEAQATVNYNVINGGAQELPGLVKINSSFCNFINCNIKNSAGTGLIVNEQIHNVNVDKCNILDSYGCGVFISKNNSRTASLIPCNISITNCTVDGFGKMYCGAVGIIATYVLNLNISHNTICNGTYTGISAGWGWTGNAPDSAHNNYSITYNKIYNVVDSALFDGGPIYVLGGFINPQGIQTNDISHNYLEFDNGLGVIYLDEASSNWHVHHNAIKVNNKGSHWHGTLFNHNPMYTSRDYYTVSHSNHFDHNYASGCAEYKTNTYEIPAYAQYSGTQLENYQNTHDIVVEQPILVTDPLIKPDIYYSAGSNFDGSEILDDINFAKYAISADSTLNLNNHELEFTINGEYGFSLNSEYLQNLALSGYRNLHLKVKAESIDELKVGSLVWHAAGEVDWRLFFKDYRVSHNGVVEANIDIPLDLFTGEGGYISIQARDENGASGAIYRKAKYTISEVKAFKASPLSAATGNFTVISSTNNSITYQANDVSYNWNRILFKDTKAYFDQGYTSVSVAVQGNRHNLYVFKGDTAIFVPENRINVDGGVYTLDIDDSGEGINILTSHEDINCRQDDEGVYGVTENMQICYTFNKNKTNLSFRNTIEFFRYFSVNKINSQTLDGFNVDINGTFTLNNSLMNSLYEHNYTNISFDVTPDALSNCKSIVLVRRTVRDLNDGLTYYSDGNGGYFCYPQSCYISNGKIHVSISSASFFEDYDRIDLVLRNEKGYGGVVNETISGGLISNIVVS